MWISPLKLFLFVIIAMVASTGLLIQFNAKINNKSKDLYLYDWAVIKANETIMNTSIKEEHPIILIEPHNPDNSNWEQNITPEYLQETFRKLLNYTPDWKIYMPQSETKANENKNIYFILKKKVFVSGSTLKEYLDNGIGKILDNNTQMWFTMYYFPIKYVIPNGTPTEQEIKKAWIIYNEIVNALEQTCRMPREWQLYCY